MYTILIYIPYDDSLWNRVDRAVPMYMDTYIHNIISRYRYSRKGGNAYILYAACVV